MPRGIIGGIAGGILKECLTGGITGVVFLTPVIAFVPHPEGAVALIEAINRVMTQKETRKSCWRRQKR